MPITKMYSNKAIIFDPSSYPLGLDTKECQDDFIAAAIEYCDGFLPSDYYIADYCDDVNRNIVVQLKRYKDGQNLQSIWTFQLTADPIDDHDRQWIVFDVVRWDASTIYAFELP
jgi:hypothetical protein